MSNNKDKSDNNNIEKTVLSYETDNAKDIRRTVRDNDKNIGISKEPAFEIRYGTIYRIGTVSGTINDK
jgi:hypothetical protein